MTDSLIAGGYELIGATTNPEYRLAPGWDFGEGVPDSATISSTFLDGDTVVSTRTGNRSVTLPVMVFASSRLDLASKIDVLRQALSASSWRLQWTPNGGLPMILDCYRATVTRVRDLIRDASFSADLKIECSALPFGRSPNVQTISIAGQTQIDSYDTAPTGATLDTSVKYEGTGSAKVVGTRLGPLPGALYSYTFPTVSRSFAAKDLSADQAVTVRTLWQPPSTLVDDPSIGVAGQAYLYAELTLNSASGTSVVDAAPVIASISDASWHLFTFPLAGIGGTVDLSAVTSYSLKLSDNPSSYSSAPTSTSNAWVDDLRALPAASARVSTSRGSLLTVPAVVGSARTPVSLAAIGTINALLAHHPPVDQDANAQILTGVTIAASPSHPAATTIATANATFNGTYSAVLGVSTVGAAGSNTVTVTITQLANGSSVASQVMALTYTSPQADRLVKLGEVTLPLRAVPADNTTTTYTIDINHSAGADAYSDFMLLDTRGQTVIADPASAVGAVYIDAPTALTNVGNVYASAAGNRTDTYGILDTALVSGGPFVFDPGNNGMLIWADASVPTLTTTYYPRWLDERVT